ncbi:30S ribosomal protein S7 [Brachyspira hyodysenteriae]|uniref:Small ribosomal subunit protein uS7 n=3 Tax=Brachyspira TaxID=29521 RepID=RS7_BRAHW|nr:MULTISPECIES: 30S ribosomal protein S7 [Brachyspira]C0QVZ2.1 RecName: Full=Small ribosomal subunit protein uS7; AltName: Full=30S ribosomal protein S7 [Brachyspira hyodysenteriae WA1]ACN84578.1 30S ribosomal protein S7 [Brachyspira hyodysenteriae WA1]AEM23156.1 30S ribosomal protein S7 [Brachyspira intermedia PWS/A]ANN63347.1 30S ribosomal protein S7 [Brachyspira hyodysenteriae ATCC 27164]AUJ50310.1 30S ribosomal protein S7 [Brachyspira hyodysenteriae]KLI13837.1 30S ribosomal protein S7 [B
MARRRRAQTRKIDADPVYGSVVISKFINKLMYDGKKSKAENIFYKAMDLVKEKTGKDGLEAFNEAIENIKPRVEVKSRRVGGSTYQVPVDVRPDRQNSLAFTWLIDASRKRGGRSMIERLSNEIVDAIDGKGQAVAKRDTVHRMAEGNKAFAHFRW